MKIVMKRNESARKQHEKWNEMMSNKIGHGNGCENEIEKCHGNEAVPCHVMKHIIERNEKNDENGTAIN